MHACSCLHIYLLACCLVIWVSAFLHLLCLCMTFARTSHQHFLGLFSSYKTLIYEEILFSFLFLFFIFFFLNKNYDKTPFQDRTTSYTKSCWAKALTTWVMLENLSNFSELVKNEKKNKKKEKKKQLQIHKFTWFTTKDYIYRVTTKFHYFLKNNIMRR